MPRKLITVSDTKSLISEQFRTIRANISFSLPGEDLKTILVTSSIPGEGKSTNAANLAVVFAQEGKKVLLVDADMRKPTLHYTFNLSNLDGLSTILSGKQQYSITIQETFMIGLHILPSGPIPPNPAELLSTKNVMSFLEQVKEEYDLIIIDAPPLLSVSDSLILANKCEGTLLIIKSGVTKKEDVLRAKEILETSQAKLLGVVLNNYKMPKNNYYDLYTNSDG